MHDGFFLILKSPPHSEVVMEIGCTQLSLSSASVADSTHVLCFGNGKLFPVFFFRLFEKKGRWIPNWRFAARQVSDYLPLKNISWNSAESNIEIEPFGFIAHKTPRKSWVCEAIKFKIKVILLFDYEFGTGVTNLIRWINITSWRKQLWQS